MEQGLKKIENKAEGVVKSTPTQKVSSKKQTAPSYIKSYTVKVAFCGFSVGDVITRDSRALHVKKCVEQGYIE